ncbi:MAG: endonuclease NucS [Lachnospiraceae bacterium]|jgi:predicted transport protein|nr:endonuclease NucS [Lachnospiraceae bacterium]
MADIKLFKTKPVVEELTVSAVALEKELQTLLENNMQTFFGITFLRSEYQITNGRIDSIGIDENNCPVIIEYKRSVSENVINQGLFYLDWLLDHKADFKLLVIDELGMDKATEIDWSMPCVICVANDFTKYDEHAVNQMNKNIRLVRYKLFSDDLILLEQINAPNVAPLKESFTKDTPTSSKDKTYKNFEEQLATTHPKILQIYESLHDYIMSLGDDISENRLKLYSAYKKLKNVVCLEVRAKSIMVYLRLNPTDVELKEGFCRDVTNIGHWGTGDVELIIKDDADFIKAKDYILKAYQKN